MLGDSETGWDDGINYKAISCEKIPDLFLDKLVAKNHFSKYGKITRFILRPSRQSCTVEYETEAQAERALDQGGEFNGKEFKVEYAKREVAHVQNTEEWVNPEVQAELDAMGLRESLPAYRIPSTALLPPHKGMASRSQKSAIQLSPPAFKSLKSSTPSTTELTKVDTALRQEYEAILRRPAYTFEEKYRVLDARDKLMRLIRPRQTDIKKVESTKGICPDMCPEKERLMREFQRQVSTFEMCNDDEGNISSISHQRAIKEYSRSSADQEVPLAHELRPESVLQMTMLYLMHRIMDLCNDPQTSIADWFHFVWDRTRSIRKDITQQELCSLATVQLVEQCARFHIHCAARLVAEDPSVFDKKINAENLTKCLQSLKYMYHDLRIKGIHCPCEAEFRSYIVLLNMGDSNFLWELKQLPVQIQNSKEIKQSIAFYNALQNNNYVRFFTMIRETETSYLSACILLGYFNKLRWRAMEAINKSHNWRKNAVLLPLSYLTGILGFEDEKAAAQYFTYHGLKCDGQRVLLDRLHRPDIDYAMDRALNLVESKRTVSVGECIYGHILESADIFESHVPHNSFDDYGLLKDLAWTADDQLRGKAAEERRQQRDLEKKQQQQDKLKVQKRPNTPPLILTPIAAPPSQLTDANIFKVPKTTLSSTSPKQQQAQFKTPQMPKKTLGSSAIGGNKFVQPKVTSAQSAVLASFKFEAPQMQNEPISNNSADGSSLFDATAKDDDSGLFKTPFVAKASSTNAGSGFVGFGSSSIFGGNATGATKSSSAAGGFLFDSACSKGDNIFSSAVKSTAGTFQQTKLPEPMRNDSVFQHFNTRPVLSGLGKPLMGLNETPKNVFGSVSFNQLSQNSPKADDGWSDEGLEDGADISAEAKLNQQRELERQRQQEQKEKEAAARRRATEREKEETLKALQLRAERITVDDVNSFVEMEIASLAKTELSKYRNFEFECQRLADLLLDQCIAMQLDELTNEEYAIMCHDQIILSRYFKRWLRYTRKKQKQHALMESTPIWVTMDTRAEQTAKVMHPSESENMEMIKRYRHGEPCNFQLLLWKHPDTPRAPHVTLDIFEIVRAHSIRKNAIKRGHLQRNRYFKLLLTLPNDTDELPGFESLCNKWLEKYVRRVHHTSAEDNENTSTSPYICAMDKDVALCVRKLCGIPAVAESGHVVRNECDHADAIICLMACDNIHSTRKRIHHLIKLSHLHKSVPVAFIVYDGQYTDELELSDVLEMESLVGKSEGGAVSTYKFFGCLQSKNQFSFPHLMGRALRYVARESSFCRQAVEALEMQNLQSWLDSCLGEELWQRWQFSAEQNPSFAKICSTLPHLVELYNEAVQRVIQLAIEDIEEAPEFAEELRKFVPKLEVDIPLGLEHFPKDWKSTQRQTQITRFLKRLLLASVEGLPHFGEVVGWELWLLNYVSSCITNDEEAANAASYQAVKALIEQLNRPELSDIELEARLKAINFLPVLKSVAFTQIQAVLKEYDVSGNKLPQEIIYNSQALEDYLLIPWWLNNKAVEAVKIDYSTLEKEEYTSSLSKELPDETAALSGDALNEIIKQAEEVSLKAEAKFYSLKKQTVSADTTELSRDLDASIYQFELAKEFGSYEINFMSKLCEINSDLEGVTAVGSYTNTSCCQVGDEGGGDGMTITPARRRHKRKLTTVKEDSPDDIEEVLKRAFNVIEKVEAVQDRTRRAHDLSQ
ncbi:protein xmas [Eurosta solidaginis]|uniref:protein xmas n=1 Tax=Eurosta solidaginis TaxID=178769 RepID=UPI003530581C